MGKSVYLAKMLHIFELMEMAGLSLESPIPIFE
jgi:hypothetical protein